MDGNSIRKSVTLVNSVQTDIDSAKSIARKIFETYDRDRSTVLENYEIQPLLQDVYKSMNRSFTPSKLDIESYARVLDRDGNGKVTLQDVEALCIRYLVGEDALSRSQAGGYANQYGPGAGGYQDAGETVKRSAYGGYNDPYGGLSQSRTYDLGQSQTQQPGEYAKRAGAPQQQYGGDVRQSGQYGDIRQSGSYGNTVKVVKRAQLEETRKIFDKFDTDRSGYIDEHELKVLLQETYKILGVNKTITQDDVESYLRMVDTNRDGRISPEEYEVIVIKSLEKIGVVLE